MANRAVEDEEKSTGYTGSPFLKDLSRSKKIIESAVVAGGAGVYDIAGAATKYLTGIESPKLFPEAKEAFKQSLGGGQPSAVQESPSFKDPGNLGIMHRDSSLGPDPSLRVPTVAEKNKMEENAIMVAGSKYFKGIGFKTGMKTAPFVQQAVKEGKTFTNESLNVLYEGGAVGAGTIPYADTPEKRQQEAYDKQYNVGAGTFQPSEAVQTFNETAGYRDRQVTLDRQAKRLNRDMKKLNKKASKIKEERKEGWTKELKDIKNQRAAIGTELSNVMGQIPGAMQAAEGIDMGQLNVNRRLAAVREAGEDTARYTAKTGRMRAGKETGFYLQERQQLQAQKAYYDAIKPENKRFAVNSNLMTSEQYDEYAEGLKSKAFGNQKAVDTQANPAAIKAYRALPPQEKTRWVESQIARAKTEQEKKSIAMQLKAMGIDHPFIYKYTSQVQY